MGASQPEPIMLWAAGALSLALFLFMVRPALDSRRWKMAMDTSPNGLMMGLLGVLVFYRFSPSPELLPAIIVAILVHEYGHVLAMRLAGHPAPVFRLAPFGGYAFSTQARSSEAENAFVALMGPGFSVVLLVACLLASMALRDVSPVAAGYALHSAWLVALLNYFNLLPLYPLDGGHALRAIARTAGPGAAHWVALLMSAATAAFAIVYHAWLLLFIALLGLAEAMRMSKDTGVKPMSWRVALLALSAHLAVLATHFVMINPRFVTWLLSTS